MTPALNALSTDQNMGIRNAGQQQKIPCFERNDATRATQTLAGAVDDLVGGPSSVTSTLGVLN